MADYLSWNASIIQFALSSYLPGEPLYLSVDDRVLERLGDRIGIGEPNPREDFVQALRAHCVYDGKIRYRTVAGDEDQPIYAAFLAGLVLAAYDMHADEDAAVASHNYRTRFEAIFGLTKPQFPEVEGWHFEAYREDGLWRRWNRWVERQGRLATAERGRGAWEAVGYPISQALFRETDRQKIAEHFSTIPIRARIDRDALGTWISNNAPRFSTQHLRKLALEADPKRYQAVVDAAFEIIENLQDGGEPVIAVKSLRMPAELFRDRDPYSGEPVFLLCPRKTGRWDGQLLKAWDNTNEKWKPMHDAGARWFEPLWPVDPAGDIQVRVQSASQEGHIILPRRDYWVFLPDADDTSSPNWRTGGRPDVKDPFHVLCRSESVAGDINFLKGQQLLKYKERATVQAGAVQWEEYRECRIIDHDWEGIARDSDFVKRLTPRADFRIGLIGGLKAPNQPGWMEGFPPKVQIIATDAQIDVEVRVAGAEAGNRQTLDVAKDTPLFDGRPAGSYVVTAFVRNQAVRRRNVRLIGWDELRHAPV